MISLLKETNSAINPDGKKCQKATENPEIYRANRSMRYLVNGGDINKEDTGSQPPGLRSLALQRSEYNMVRYFGG